jgi:hypothetical protein
MRSIDIAEGERDPNRQLRLFFINQDVLIKPGPLMGLCFSDANF